jgi:HK97 family phage major capsid protein
MSRTENTAFVRGTGALSPKGFLSYTAASAADTYQRGTIGQFTGTGASALIDSASDLKSVQALMKEAYQGGAVWGMKRATFGSVVNLKDTYGQFVFQSRFINEMDNQTLLGKEVVFMDDMDAIAASALAIVYANFKLGYTIVDRFGFRVIRDDVTNKPYVQFYTTKRVGGDVTNYDCIKLLKVKP